MTNDSDNQQPVTFETSQSQPEATEAFRSQYAELADNLPELQQRPEVQRVGQQLIDQFQIRPSLFENPGRAVIFTAIASQWAEVGEDKNAIDSKAAYLFDTLSLLAGEHSDALAEADDLIKKQEGYIDDKDTLEVYDAYTNTELTKRVVEKIDAGFLDKTKELLGITPENETPYTVRVFDFADELQLSGIDAPKPDYSLRFDDPVYQTQLEKVQEMKAWKETLVENGKRFTQDLAKKGDPHGGFAPAWVTRIDGAPVLCISTGLAKKIIDPEVIKNTDWYTEKELSADLAVLSHEYTHTQGGLSDENARLGINLEELRAEHFSGNRQGYQDVKALFRDYSILTGHDIIADIATRSKGGPANEIYTAIAQRVGLSTLLDLLVASPKNYVDAQSDATKRSFETIGGYDGVLNDILQQQLRTGSEEVRQRIDQVAENLRRSDQNNPGSFDTWYAYRQRIGVTIVADAVKARLEQAG